MPGAIDLGKILTYLEDTLLLSRKELARILDVEPKTVDRWYSGSHFPQGQARRRLDALHELSTRLEDSFTTSESAHLWLTSGSRYLGGWPPRDALLLGRVDRVNAALDALPDIPNRLVSG